MHCFRETSLTTISSPYPIPQMAVRWAVLAVCLCGLASREASAQAPAPAGGEWEVTADSELALERGLAWLARNQGAAGNWESNDLGLVSLGAMAFLSAGHMPGRGKYGDAVDRALGYVARNMKPSGLLNIADAQRDMYNHGLAAFVLGQAYGMTDDPQLGRVLEKSLKLIATTQCDDGGWDYRAKRQERGHDLSLVVMQAKALRSAVDSGFEVRGDVIRSAMNVPKTAPASSPTTAIAAPWRWRRVESCACRSLANMTIGGSRRISN